MEETEKSWQETSDSNVSAMEKDGPVPTDEFFQDVQNGGSLSLDIVQQLHFTEQHVGSEEDPSFHGIHYDGSLSPNTEQNLNIIIQNLKSKKAFLDHDENGRPILQYKQKSKVFWDASKANMITDCGTDDDVRRKTDSALDFINHLKTNCPPSGVRYNKKQVHTHYGRYREGYEFEKTEKVLGSGTVAGDIVVIKDKTTGMESAQKTIMLSVFRKEEIEALVDLAETGFPPALYLFKLEGNKVQIYMEIISEAFTLRKIIDDYRMDSSLAKQFSRFVLDSLLSVAVAFYDKGWVQRDFHAGNLMMQKHSESKLIVRILDFGNAQSFDECQELKFESLQRDIMEVLRIFSALYCGQEFCDALDLQRNWQKWIKKVNLADKDKEELVCLIDSAMNIVRLQDVPIFHGLVQEKLQSALPDAQSHDDMMRRVLAVLFPDTKDFRAILHELKEDYLPESNPPGVADSVVRNHPHSPNVKHLASSGKTVAINPIDELLSLSSSIEPE